MNARAYRERQPEVTAIRFTGGNSVAVAEFLRAAAIAFKTATDPQDAAGDVFYVHYRDGAGVTIAKDGDWVIKDDEGDVWVARDREFTKRYDAIEAAS